MAVDDLVVVAHAEHVERGRRQQPHQQHVGRGQVLELVDQQVPVPRLLSPAERTVAQQQLDGEQHLLVEVDDATAFQLGPEAGERLGQPGDVAPLVLDRDGGPQAQADGGEGLDVGRQRVGVEPAGAGGDERFEQAPDLALLDHLGPPPQPLGDDAVAEGVEREDAPAHARGATGHLVAGLAVVGHGHDRRGLVASIDDQVAQALGEHPGLARPRRGDDPRRARPVGDGCELVGRQVGRRPGQRRHRAHVARLDRLGRHDGRPAGEGDDVVAAGAAVDPGRTAVGQHDVAVRLAVERRGARLQGLATPPPDRIAAAAGVVGVGPHQEVEPVVRQVECGREHGRVVSGEVGPDRARGAEVGGVDPQGDDHRSAPGPVLVEGVDHVGSLVGRGVERVEDGAVDGDDRRRGPGGRHRVADVHDDAPAEAGRARCAHGGEATDAV